MTRIILAILAATLLLAPPAAANPNPTWGTVEKPCTTTADCRSQHQQSLSLGVSKMRAEFAPVANVTAYDWRFEAAALDGVTLLPLLNQWNPQGTLPDPQTFATFTAAMVARYGPNGTYWASRPDLTPTPPTWWELLNEPDLTYGVQQHDIYSMQPEAYGALIKTVIAAGRQANPQAKYIVYVGGTIPTFKGRKQTYTEWISRLLTVSGVCSYVDAWATHPYNGWALSQASWSYASDNRRCGPRELWITELGWSTNNVSEQQQAANVTTWANLVRSTSGVAAFFYFQIRDSAQTFQYGLFRQDGSGKPSAAAYATAVGQ